VSRSSRMAPGRVIGRLVRRLLGSVRVRVTVTALLAVGCALLVAAVVVRVDLRHDRQRILMETAQVDAREVVAFNPDLSNHIILPADSNITTGFLQVLVHNRVVGASRALKYLPPLWRPGDPTIESAPDSLVDTAKDVEQVSVPVAIGGTKADVVVVASMDQFDHTVADVQRQVDLGGPILLALVGLICWLIVGRALRPIEAMRREVAIVAGNPVGRHRHRVAEPANDDEVGRLARTLNLMLDRMEASTERERRFVSDASHELRSPIANIRTGLEVALRHPEAVDWWQVAGEVLDQNGRMEQLVAGLLLLARSDEGSLIASSEPTDLAEVADQVVAQQPDGGPSIELTARPAPVRVPVVYAERMIGNLVDNARRFASNSITVSVGPVPGTTGAGPAGTSPAEFVEVWVADDGPGVPEQQQERIFERFVRLDEARNREDGGFGLGLAIVADLSRFYGGSIRVEPGRPGAVFVLRLPAAPAAPTPAATPTNADSVTPTADPVSSVADLRAH
jgi:signal transduction histidine kinase